MKILIKNGRILNPATGIDDKLDLLVVGDCIEKQSREITDEADLTIDASGCFVMPGLIDLHVHLRDPGFLYKETIETGIYAAAKGGFTTICAMPNTSPATDSLEVVNYIKKEADRINMVHVLPIGAVTLGQEGKKLINIQAMKEAGICAISEDGKSVLDVSLYKEAMVAAKKNNIPVFAHCEDADLVKGGLINEGTKAQELGFPGISNESEEVIVERDILLAKETKVHLHLCHCSTEGSVELVEKAKNQGVQVTAEVCPHHFTLTQEDIPGDDANYKMNPPLRSLKDQKALLTGLKNNSIDVIATDHAPHSEEEKRRSIKDAPFGITGLETAVSLTITELLHKGVLTPIQIAEKLSYNPARILGIDKGNIEPGKIADITIIDPEAEYIIDKNTFVSKGKNTPFHRKKVKGKVVCTIAEGKVVYKND